MRLGCHGNALNKALIITWLLLNVAQRRTCATAKTHRVIKCLSRCCQRGYSALKNIEKCLCNKLTNMMHVTMVTNVQYNTVNNQESGIIFIDAAGGTGKTHLINLIIRYMRSINKNVCASSSSGIAATLLENGSTVHSKFKVPLKIFDN